jgi:signal transduction histidine kinase
MEDVDAYGAVSELFSMVEPQIEAKGLACEVRRPPAPLVVHADREKLTQVLLNLLSNAIKFTPRGGRVTVDFSTNPNSPQVAYIHVSDNGIGVPKDKHEAIFEPFVQVQTGPTRAVEGAGLGLAISRELARGMGGDVGVRSRDGGGSTFTLTLQRSTPVT